MAGSLFYHHDPQTSTTRLRSLCGLEQGSNMYTVSQWKIKVKLQLASKHTEVPWATDIKIKYFICTNTLCTLQSLHYDLIQSESMELVDNEG